MTAVSAMTGLRDPDQGRKIVTGQTVKNQCNVKTGNSGFQKPSISMEAGHTLLG